MTLSRPSELELIFGDILLDHSFELVSRDDDPGRTNYDRIFGEDHTGQPGADRGSTIEVRVYPRHVDLQWVTSWIRPANGYPTFSFPIPERSVEAVTQLERLIQLAELKERTGETLLGDEFSTWKQVGRYLAANGFEPQDEVGYDQARVWKRKFGNLTELIVDFHLDENGWSAYFDLARGVFMLRTASLPIPPPHKQDKSLTEFKRILSSLVEEARAAAR